jgi:RNA polymerase sigma-70 factor, ECF subfamily
VYAVFSCGHALVELGLAESERMLLERAVSGDDGALSELLVGCDAELRSRFSGKIHRRYRSVLSIADVLQVTYMEAFLRISRFRVGGNGSFVNWLAKIADSNLISAIRELNRQKRPPRQRQISLSMGTNSHIALLATLAGSQASPSQQASRSEIRDAIDRAISLLPPDYRDVVQGFDIDGIDTHEIAARMQRSPGAVYMIKARAHIRLAEILGDSTQFFSRGGERKPQ